MMAGTQPAEMLHRAAVQALLEGRTLDSLATIARALAFAPNDPAMLNDAAAMAQSAHHRSAAFNYMQRAIAAAPHEVSYAINLAVLHRQGGDTDAAMACLDQALARQPDCPEAVYQRALTLARRHDATGALAGFHHCLALRPAWFEAEVGVATALQELDRLDAAIALYRDIVAREPGRAAAHNNLGRALLNLPAPEAALACFERAQALAPQQAEIRYNRALTLLGLGRLAEGWQAHDARWDLAQPPSPRRGFDGVVPRWDGSKLAGRRLLLHAEQGFGDTLQFIRFARTARRAGRTRDGTVMLEAPMPLQRLFGCLLGDGGIDEMVAPNAVIAKPDVQLPLLDLPRVLEIALHELGAEVPYLQATACRAGPPRIGVVWAGNPAHSNDRRRSLPPAILRRLIEGSPARFVSLQVGAAVQAVGHHGLLDALPAPRDFLETAERIMALDLVITVDTSVAHLAGALGAPTWVLVPFVPDWRWGFRGTSTPWYPTMRLFRQPSPGNWAGVCDAVRAAIADRFATPPPFPVAEEYA